jgi:hypothetical protein
MHSMEYYYIGNVWFKNSSSGIHKVKVAIIMILYIPNDEFLT